MIRPGKKDQTRAAGVVPFPKKKQQWFSEHSSDSDWWSSSHSSCAQTQPSHGGGRPRPVASRRSV